jgi:hypothetical protein
MSYMCFIKYRALKTYDKVEVYVHILLTLVPNVCEYLPSRPDHIKAGKRVLVNHKMGSWTDATITDHKNNYFLYSRSITKRAHKVVWS